MGWSQEVHASRVQSTPRKKIQSQPHLPLPKPTKTNAGLFPIIFVVGAISTSLWWRKSSHNLGGGQEPLAAVGKFFQRLLGGPGKRTGKSRNDQWKGTRPASMAAAAAAQREQVSFTFYI